MQRSAGACAPPAVCDGAPSSRPSRAVRSPVWVPRPPPVAPTVRQRALQMRGSVAESSHGRRTHSRSPVSPRTAPSVAQRVMQRSRSGTRRRVFSGGGSSHGRHSRSRSPRPPSVAPTVRQRELQRSRGVFSGTTSRRPVRIARIGSIHSDMTIPADYSLPQLSRLVTGMIRHGFDHGPITLTALCSHMAGIPPDDVLAAIQVAGKRKDVQSRLVLAPLVGGGLSVRALRR